MYCYQRAEVEPEPWIEQLIQNYGQSQRELSVSAHVVGKRSSPLRYRFIEDFIFNKWNDHLKAAFRVYSRCLCLKLNLDDLKHFNVTLAKIEDIMLVQIL